MSAITPHAAGHDAGHDHHGHDHPPHLAHHFDTPEQQFDSAKIGMWVFLATEILMFGGLFCAYAVYRYNNPDVFRYTEHHLNTALGATNTVVLLASSLTMALAVRAAQLGQQGLLKVMLGLTILGGFGFMGIKTVEYKEKFAHGLVPGIYNDYSREDTGTKETYNGFFAGFAAHAEEHGEAPGEAHSTDPAEEHGADPKGAPGDIDSEHGTDAGHGADAAEDHSSDAAADHDAGPIATTATTQDAEAAGGESGEAAEANAPTGRDLRFMGPDYVDPNLGSADAALVRPAFTADKPAYVVAGDHGHHGVDYEDLNVKSKSNVKAFFGIYFMMTGLHGVHVLIGMGLIGWILLRATTGEFGPGYFTPVDLVGLYWHLVDLIWIFLFPLLYLIH